jgi:hypothetical protein
MFSFPDPKIGEKGIFAFFTFLGFPYFIEEDF